MRRNVMIAFFAAVTIAALVFASAGPLMSNVEQPEYTVQRSDGPIELRAYPPMVVASTTVQGDRRASISDGFRILAGYIFGGNAGSKKVEMTAPVMQARASVDTLSTEMAETKPGTWAVRFVMPRAWSLDTLPKPKDPRVELTTSPASTFAVIRFSGFARDAVLKAKTAELSTFIANHRLEPKGNPIFAFYNPPWTLPFFRRNEVLIAIRSR